MKTVEIARVSKPHGVRGELKVVPHWDQSDALLEARELIVELPEAGARTFRVEGARRAHRTVLLKLVGIDDRDQAAELRGARISMGREELPKAATILEVEGANRRDHDPVVSMPLQHLLNELCENRL